MASQEKRPGVAGLSLRRILVGIVFGVLLITALAYVAALLISRETLPVTAMTPIAVGVAFIGLLAAAVLASSGVGVKRLPSALLGVGGVLLILWAVGAAMAGTRFHPALFFIFMGAAVVAAFVGGIVSSLIFPAKRSRER